MISLLRDRRSIRKYNDRIIEKDKIDILKEAVLRSPSSKNINPWEFVFVNDKSIIEQIAHCKPHGVAPLYTAPLAVVVLADETKNDVWVEDCSIASIILQLQAQSVGLSSCWVQIRKRMQDENTTAEQYLKSLLSVPKHFRVLSVITIGYPAQERTGKPYSELQFEKIHTNKF